MLEMKPVVQCGAAYSSDEIPPYRIPFSLRITLTGVDRLGVFFWFGKEHKEDELKWNEKRSALGTREATFLHLVHGFRIPIYTLNPSYYLSLRELTLGIVRDINNCPGRQFYLTCTHFL